jgi:myo-inositol-1(or 4)-monophosphatase
LINEGRNGDLSVATKSGPDDFVTDFDQASEALIVSMISAERPDDAIIGEEGTQSEGTTGVTWFIDPIDGTTSYVYGHPIFSVSVGAQLNGITIAGAVCIPRLGELYSASRGGGAVRNGQPINVGSHQLLQECIVGTGFSGAADVRLDQARWLSRLLPQIRDLRRDGSAAAELCFVADGRLDAYYEHGLSTWDMCAGRLIVEEAGGVTTILDLPLSTLCAGNPEIHAVLSGRLRDIASDSLGS